MYLRKLHRKFKGVSNVRVEGRQIKFDAKDPNMKRKVRMSVSVKEFINEV